MIAAMAPPSSSLSFGDRPSVGSSSISMLGAPISPTPMATICRSPPLSVRQRWRRRSASRGKSCEHVVQSVRLRSARARAAKAPSSRFSSTVMSGNSVLPCGTWISPRSTIRARRLRGDVGSPRKLIAADQRGRISPEMAFEAASSCRGRWDRTGRHARARRRCRLMPCRTGVGAVAGTQVCACRGRSQACAACFGPR